MKFTMCQPCETIIPKADMEKHLTTLWHSCCMSMLEARRSKKALAIVAKLKDEGCILYNYDRDNSDYHCRYCNRRTKTNTDETIEHADGCMWLELEKL